MEKFKSTNDDVDVIVNEYGDDEDQDEEEEEDEEELYVVIYTVEINYVHPQWFSVSMVPLLPSYCSLQQTMRYLLIPMDVSFKV